LKKEGIFIKILKKVFSLESLFAIYLFAGYIKTSIGSTIDLTLLLLVVTFIGAFLRLKKADFQIHKNYLYPIFFYLFVLFAMIVSLLYTPSDSFAYEKVIRFAIINGWCILGPLFIIRDLESLKKFFVGIIVVAMMMAVAFFTDYDPLAGGFNSALGSNYLSLARASTMGFLILITLFLFIKNNVLKFIVLASSIIFAIPLLESGGRLPVIILGLVLLIFPITFFKIEKNDIKISKKIIPYVGSFIVIISGVTFLIYNGYAGTLINRLLLMFEAENGGASVGTRTDLLLLAIDMAKQNLLFGNGIGSFSYFLFGYDGDHNPHNMYVEYMAEIGIAPAVLWFAFVLVSVIRAVKTFKVAQQKLMFTMLLIVSSFWILNSFISSSIIGDKMLNAFVTLLFITPTLLKKNYQEKQLLKSKATTKITIQKTTQTGDFLETLQ